MRTFQKGLEAMAAGPPAADGSKDASRLRPPRIMGFAGWSGSGKTTLIARLIPLFTARGVTVSTIKHAHHAFDVDKPGKDSYEHRNAGATEVLVASSNRWALMHELRGACEPELHELLAKLAPVDLVLVEGFKRTTPVKIEVHRPSLGKPLIYPSDPAVAAVASDVPIPPASTISTLALNDIDGIADFVLMRAVPATQLCPTRFDTPSSTQAAENKPPPGGNALSLRSEVFHRRIFGRQIVDNHRSQDSNTRQENASVGNA
jgi:molybdopterin-guanine dinucleotide biosynthesis adapter protein